MRVNRGEKNLYCEFEKQSLSQSPSFLEELETKMFCQGLGSNEEEAVRSSLSTFYLAAFTEEGADALSGSTCNLSTNQRSHWWTYRANRTQASPIWQGQSQEQRGRDGRREGEEKWPILEHEWYCLQVLPDVSNPILGQFLKQMGYLIILAPWKDHCSCHSSVKWALTDVLLSSKRAEELIEDR